jgi:hypothetical protein
MLVPDPNLLKMRVTCIRKGNFFNSKLLVPELSMEKASTLLILCAVAIASDQIQNRATGKTTLLKMY